MTKTESKTASAVVKDILANEINPRLALRKSPVAERIEERPIYAVIGLPIQFHLTTHDTLRIHNTTGLSS